MIMKRKNLSLKCYKLIVLGNSGVGKTTILRQYINNEKIKTSDYNDLHPSATIGCDFFWGNYKNPNNNNKKYKFQLLDIAGQERYLDMALDKNSILFKKVSGIFIVFDVNNLNSIQSLGKWIHIIQNNITKQNIPILFLGNKTDLNFTISKKQICDNIVKQLSNQNYNFITLKSSSNQNQNQNQDKKDLIIFTSAYKNTNIYESFQKMFQFVVDENQENEDGEEEFYGSSINEIEESQDSKNNTNKKCCF